MCAALGAGARVRYTLEATAHEDAPVRPGKIGGRQLAPRERCFQIEPGLAKSALGKTIIAGKFSGGNWRFWLCRRDPGRLVQVRF